MRLIKSENWCGLSQTPAAENRSGSTNLDQAGEVFQHARHRKLQEVVVPQVEPGQVDPGEHALGEAPQQVGVQEQQLEGRHGVEGAGIHLPDLVVLEVQVPRERRRVRATKATQTRSFLLRNRRSGTKVSAETS